MQTQYILQSIVTVLLYSHRTIPWRTEQVMTTMEMESFAPLAPFLTNRFHSIRSADSTCYQMLLMEM